MNFFKAQDNARRATRWLILVYLLAYAIIVPLASILLLVYPAIFGLFVGSWVTLNNDALGFLLFSSIAATFVVFLVVISKTLSVSLGGGKVATMLGATRLDGSGTEAPNLRLRNVVEEMAIASGVPVPDVYVLEQEEAINAFTAGFSPADAAITVTQGAVQLLSRDELQGVVGHEFSHILNGDMRLYTRMLGPQHGLGVIASIGLTLMRGHIRIPIRIALHMGRRMVETFKEDPVPIIAIIVLAPLWMPVVFGFTAVMLVAASPAAILGFVGQQLARAIKGAVSRHREYLADASAVQFTRQTTGIVGALKKIGGYSKASYLTADDAEEVSHMLFGRGAERFVGFRTHPPIAERIKALDPTFREGDYPHVEPIFAPQVTDEEEPADQSTAGIGFIGASETSVVSPAEIAESVGQPSSAHVEYSKELRRSIPDNLYDAAHSLEMVYPLTVALILDRSGRYTERQMQVVEQEFGTSNAELVRDYYVEVSRLGAEYRLPLLEMAFPALKRREKAALIELASFTVRLAEIDHDIDLYEFCFGRILRRNLLAAVNPSQTESHQIQGRAKVGQAAAYVLMMVAQKGHEDAAAELAALDAGRAVLGQLIAGAHIDLQQRISIDILDGSLNMMLALHGDERRNVVLAICETAAYDGRFEVAERELIRVVCASLDCPLPPILVANL